MATSSFYQLLQKNFPLEATLKQEIFLQKIAPFVEGKTLEDVFILKGYAGTGKTTIISLLVNQLKYINKKAVLLAPTGRAAKVISNYSNQSAQTIHKRIYYTKKKSNSVAFTMQANKFKNTIFIVDESSMISDASTDSNMYVHGSLLEDLLFYVESGNNCKLILVGDTAQLPPVHLELSPALDENKLALTYQLNVASVELDQVVRQAQHSGILYNATELRTLLDSAFYDSFKFDVQPFKDIVRLQSGDDILDAIHSAYDKDGLEETVFIVYSNKRANQYNQQIRLKILSKENVLSVGDMVMAVKNNYFWLKDQTQTDFIANGDILEIMRIYKYIDLYGFSFAKVQVKMVDYPDLPAFDTVVLLDTLNSESASLTYEESNKLYQEVALDYSSETSSYKKLQKIKNNEYFNALQIKFSYAITCHKSQGGQWNKVFIEQPYLPNGITLNYVRWLYTAITRAKDTLYLIGFKDDFFV